MNSQTDEQRVFSLVRKILPGAANMPIHGDMNLLLDLNADSLSLVSLVFAMEQEFGLETATLGGLVTESQTVGDLVTGIASQKAA